MNLLSDLPPGKAEATIPSDPPPGQCSPHAVSDTFSAAWIPSTTLASMRRMAPARKKRRKKMTVVKPAG